MDKYKVFEEIQDRIADLLDFELTNAEVDACLDMIEALSKMWSRQIMEYKKEHESIM